MINKLKIKKGQSLPLNTIVIAILVIIVLLVIIVFFTNQVGNTGDQLKDNSVTQCNTQNPAIATLGYSESDLKIINEGETSGEVCDGEYEPVRGVTNCCVKKNR